MKKIYQQLKLATNQLRFLGILIFFSTSVFSQDLIIPKISLEWEPHVQYSMSLKRERLIQHLKAYDLKVNDFNNRCGKIAVENTSLISACKNESDALDKESDYIDKEVEIYKADFEYTEKIYKTYHTQKDLQAIQQKEMEKIIPVIITEVKKDIKKRNEIPNSNVIGIINSLKTKTPPPLPKKFDELESGDILLVAPEDLKGKVIMWGDRLTSLSTESRASHTITYLKEINGQKFFMDNLPFQGPSIISEKQLMEKYNSNMDVARLSGLAQPLNPEEAEKLFKAAIEMQSSNLNSRNTNYGVWGENNVVCSEASWVLINSAVGNKIPGTDFGIKSGISVKFSPADFYAMKQYFLITSLGSSK